MVLVTDIITNITSWNLDTPGETTSTWGTTAYDLNLNVSRDVFGGPAHRWTASVVPTFASDSNIDYLNFTTGGMSNSFAANESVTNISIIPAFTEAYANNSFGANDYVVTQSIQHHEINSIVTYKKEQTFLYKLRGFNTNTSQYETWIAQRVITPHFDEFIPLDDVYPNIKVEKSEIILESGNPGGFKFAVTVPSSGNILTNITVVGSWIIDTP